MSDASCNERRPQSQVTRTSESLCPAIMQTTCDIRSADRLDGPVIKACT